MARLIISTLFLTSFVLSGAFAGLIPNILPGNLPVPASKGAAVASINRGAGIGKGRVNGIVTWWTATVNSDPTLTPECKACCEAAAKEIRASVIAEIDATAATLVNEVESTLSILLAAVWNEITALLGGTNGLIVGIVSDLENSLDGAKQTCILQTANDASTTIVAIVA